MRAAIRPSGSSVVSSTVGTGYLAQVAPAGRVTVLRPSLDGARKSDVASSETSRAMSMAAADDRLERRMKIASWPSVTALPPVTEISGSPGSAPSLSVTRTDANRLDPMV